MSEPLSKQYDASAVEPRWREEWEKQGYFHADENDPKRPYAITLPPPNVTGKLHMGHALGDTIQDILIRWQRMSGVNTMWMPGTDHAGIATQMLVERDLKKRENITRHDLGREKFLERMWEWKDKFGGRIVSQLQLMGFSLDWERERFTMDPKASAAVREVFVALYEQGLIYRAHRLVNWCKDCYTAVSDLEVNNVDEQGKLWELRYPVVGSDQVLVVATTRPETMLGDTGVAVHPEDERYKDLIGKKVALPLCDREIPIVADTFVDPEFGSGAVKVTPAHDFNDFECGQRCGLESLSIIDQHGKIIAPAPAAYVGMSVEEARKVVVRDLDATGMLGEVKDYTVPRARCDRSNTVIEPLLSEQWFVKAKTLAEPAVEAVRKGETNFVPELWTKTYMHWMTNIKDWCISRQLWWGHRIPAWYCDSCSEIMVLREEPKACSKCGEGSLRQDDDVLDTWFSSALWPFSTLGWPEETRSLNTYYPNSVLVTGPDIIFFWVARMMMMGIHFMGNVPFKTVYMTPIVTDENGDKMSKVKGNVIDPLDIINGASFDELMANASENPAAQKFIKKHLAQGIKPAGSDALRFSLAAMTMPGRNIRISMERVEGYRNFVNKLWNASRFAFMNFEGFEPDRFVSVLDSAEERAKLCLADRWIWSRLQHVSEEVNEALSAYRFSEAANAMYHFVWHELCDWYIELSKPAFAEGADPHARFLTQGTLAGVLDHALRLLHPIMPFVTEEIWEKLPKESSLPSSLMVTMYPRAISELIDKDAETAIGLVQEVVSAVRQLRSTYRVPPSKRVVVHMSTKNVAKREGMSSQSDLISLLARCELHVGEESVQMPQSAKSIVGADIEVVVPLEGLIDIGDEKKRIEKQIAKCVKEIVFVEKKLNNQKFIARAPDEIVEKEKAKLAEEQTRKAGLEQALAALSG